MRIKGRSVIKIIIKSTLVLLLGVLLIVSLFYINTTIYNFPAPLAFQGDKIYNPYQNLPDSSYRANFHAHSIAWKAVTNGHNTEQDLFDGYTKRGYDIAGISNYHKISTYAKSRTELYVPVYEHGYNIFKSHYLSINSPEVSYFDYPLYQSTSHKQKIIENLKENEALIAMAHPKFAGGRSFSDMQHLVGYHFTEVLNHYRISEQYWDKALSAGRLTWIMGNDDTHDIVNEATFRIWNIIHSEKRGPNEIMNSMKNGLNYAISSKNEKCDNTLVSCLLENEVITIQLTNKADSIVFIGQNGKIVHKSIKSDSASYKFKLSDTYIRAVAYNSNSHMYLNPALRIKGDIPPLNCNVDIETNFIKTWLFRILALIFSISLVLFIRKIIRL